MTDAPETRFLQGADLFGDVEPPTRLKWRDYLPGLAVTALAALAAAYLSDHYGAPVTLMALLIGLAMNFMSADTRLHPGLGFASRTLLRIAIVLVGARVTFEQVAHLGWPALVAIVLIVAITLAAGAFVSRASGFGWPYGNLAGGAVAICGASAAMAFASLLGERRISQAQLAIVLVGISAMSALAMVAYPLLAHLLHFDDAQAGFLFGAAIHDVAQSLGAGYSFSQNAGDSASIVKLTRVALLAPAMAIVGWLFPREGGGRGGSLIPPWFVIGFFVMAAVNSAGWVPRVAAQGSSAVATAMLVCAVTATGIRSRMQTLLETGPKPLLAIVVATGVALLLAVLAALIVIR